MPFIYNRTHLPRLGYIIDTPITRLALRYWNIKLNTRQPSYKEGNEYYNLNTSNENKTIREDLPYLIQHKIEKFCNTIDILTTKNQLALLTIDNNLLQNTIFYILPFQKLMLLEYVCQMINRYNLNKYISFILLLLSFTLRIPHITWTKCTELSDFFCKEVSVHIIPRRHGKTTFMHSLMALELFFPEAGLKILYCAHHSKLPYSTFAAINSLLPSLSCLINKYEIKSYKERQLCLATSEDFYYNVTYKVYQSKKTINCFFTKYNKRGRLILQDPPNVSIKEIILYNHFSQLVVTKDKVNFLFIILCH